MPMFLFIFLDIWTDFNQALFIINLLCKFVNKYFLQERTPKSIIMKYQFILAK